MRERQHMTPAEQAFMERVIDPKKPNERAITLIELSPEELLILQDMVHQGDVEIFQEARTAYIKPAASILTLKTEGWLG